MLTYYDKPILSLEAMTLDMVENATIIISLQADELKVKEIRDRIYRALPICTIVHYGVLCSELYKPCDLDEEKMIEVASMLSDEESARVYYDCIKGIIQSDFSLFPAPSQERQYFPQSIPFSKGYSRFVDCGAFRGDTAQDLVKYGMHNSKAEAVAYFEPDLINFKLLSEIVSMGNIAKENYLFPCGVSDSIKFLRFMDNCGTCVSSHISEMGNTMLQTVDIDSTIPDFKPTFIKMDIEGSETDALIGARNTIEKYHPDLAICLYHKVEHLYEIPLLLKKFNSQYQFYIRTHSSFLCETVLYAAQTK